MCGIVGYVGSDQSVEVLLGGLKRLEYRGYDSAGVAVLGPDGTMATRKRAGKLQVLLDELESNPIPNGRTGIGHTRWATHGGPTDRNAHPHLGDDGKLALIHNGILENFAELKAELVADGATFTSETDTEVAALLVGKAYRETGDLTEAMRLVVNRLHGAFTLLIMHEDAPGVVVGARRNSPLVIGLGDGENFLGSDVAAFIEFTHRAVAIGQDQIVTIRPDFRRGDRLRRQRRRDRAVRRHLGCLRQREGRLVELHGQGDLRGAGRGREHAARAGSGRDRAARRVGAARGIPRPRSTA